MTNFAPETHAVGRSLHRGSIEYVEHTVGGQTWRTYFAPATRPFIEEVFDQAKRLDRLVFHTGAERQSIVGNPERNAAALVRRIASEKHITIGRTYVLAGSAQTEVRRIPEEV